MSYEAAGAVMDVLPERYSYRDEGCELSSSCLECPLPQCKYDNPGWLQRYRRDERDRMVLTAMRKGGLSVPEAARRFDLSQRTVFRIVRRVEATEMDPGFRTGS